MVKQYTAVLYGLALVLAAGIASAGTGDDGGTPANRFDLLDKEIRDGLSEPGPARERFRQVIPGIEQQLARQSCASVPRSAWVFPLEGYGPRAIGGSRGEGYQPAGYNYFDGNRHRGHPAHDIFVRDADQDGRDDTSSRPVRVLSLTGGLVVATNPAWETGSGIRGGKYVVVYDPLSRALVYYAHLADVTVRPGDCVTAGSPLGDLGRTGSNASARRSPTHLHLGFLAVQDGLPVPADIYADLRAAALRMPGPNLASAGGGVSQYPWLSGRAVADRLDRRLYPPADFTWMEHQPGTFAAWLSGLPLKPAGAPVLLHDGSPKRNQGVHAAVIDIDTGPRDLQQCADTVMRLRAEYLFSRGLFAAISFRFTSGDEAAYGRWRQGFRPVVSGNKVTWRKSAPPDASWRGLRTFLDTVFMYAGSASLQRELDRVERTDRIRAGDVFIQGGFPGHAVIVVGTATSPGGGRDIFLLAQSFMPAQDPHILVNPASPALSPWYEDPGDDRLTTPEWIFDRDDLMRFRE